MALAMLGACCLPGMALGTSLVPVGRAVGICLHTPGALVVALKAGEGTSPAAEAGIQLGDLIVGLGSRAVSSAADFMEAASDADGSPVPLRVLRQGQEMEFSVRPRRSDKGWIFGVWLRDNISGIGTVTFYDPETGFYGALGHPINDVDTGEMLPLGSGEVMEAEVQEVKKGRCGLPGELVGGFSFEDSCGSVLGNTACGIFGYLDSADFTDAEALEVAAPCAGDAVILTNVEGTETAEYSIRIEQVWEGEIRSLCFRVTDSALLSRTGGVVQGMSGSPIVQDGHLVGAVTHVLVNDPTRGYGISMEKMLETAETIELQTAA